MDLVLRLHVGIFGNNALVSTLLKLGYLILCTCICVEGGRGDYPYQY